MPSYLYKCNYCLKEWTENHGFNEEAKKCPFCEQDTAKRTYSYIVNINKQEDVKSSNNKIGVKTREFIEQARQELKEHKVEQKK